MLVVVVVATAAVAAATAFSACRVPCCDLSSFAATACAHGKSVSSRNTCPQVQSHRGDVSGCKPSSRQVALPRLLHTRLNGCRRYRAKYLPEGKPTQIDNRQSSNGKRNTGHAKLGHEIQPDSLESLECSSCRQPPLQAEPYKRTLEFVQGFGIFSMGAILAASLCRMLREMATNADRNTRHT